MKWKICFLLLPLIGFGSIARAQIYLVSGGNQSVISTSHYPDYLKVNSGYAWQAGISLNYPFAGNGFLYAGVEYESKKNDWHYLSCCYLDTHETDYSQYFTVPIGAGIKVFSFDKLSIAVSGGAWVSYAIGGKAKGVTENGDINIPVPYYYSRELYFGNSSTDDIKRWNLGVQTGTEIKWKNYLIRFRYKYGLTDLANPASASYGPYPSGRYRSFSLDFGYQIISIYK